MNIKSLILLLLVISYTGCKNHSELDDQDHDHEAEEAIHEHGEEKILLTAYSDDFELFAEADPFVAGEKAVIYSHFTWLVDFSPLEEGSIEALLIVEGAVASQILEAPTRRGIYSFEIEPSSIGKGVLLFRITSNGQVYEISVPGIEVFGDDQDAIAAANEVEIDPGQGITFTKEQSWKIEFSTSEVTSEVFGEVIRSSARVNPSQNDEHVVVAKTEGIVTLTSDFILPGKTVKKGDLLYTISGKTLAENNSEVRFKEAKNNYENAKTSYERLARLAEQQVVSTREMEAARNSYENAKVNFQILKDNFSASGERIVSPSDGYIRQVHTVNGQYVQAGEPMVTISGNSILLLTADVRQKYGLTLGRIDDATIRTLHNNRSYSLEELSGRIVSYGKATNEENYMIPVSMEVLNTGHFIPGEFVEVFLKSSTGKEVITVPNSAIMEELSRFTVYVQLTPELFELREITTGATDGLRTEVESGLSRGERVVTRGATTIKLAQKSGTLDAHSGHVH